MALVTRNTFFGSPPWYETLKISPRSWLISICFSRIRSTTSSMGSVARMSAYRSNSLIIASKLLRLVICWPTVETTSWVLDRTSSGDMAVGLTCWR